MPSYAKCPSCGSGEDVNVVAQMWVRLVEDGTDDSKLMDATEYDGKSSALCRRCDFSSPFALFMVPEIIRQFSVGDSVILQIETSGGRVDDLDDGAHFDAEITLPAGTLGQIERMERLGAAQGWALTILIGAEGSPQIVNVFDMADPEPRFPFKLADKGGA